MSYYEDDIKIKQALPMAEGLSPMVRFHQQDGSYKYEDAQSNGWSVLYALVGQGTCDEVRFCLLDPTGGFELVDGAEVETVPTVKCIKCGQRMIPMKTRDDELSYTCNCGTTYDPNLAMSGRWNFDNCECTSSGEKEAE